MNCALVPTVIAILIWIFVVGPLISRLGFSGIQGHCRHGFSLPGLVGFCRPHTVKGTLLATVSGYSLLSVYHQRSSASALIHVLISGVMANVFIVGINQLVDVEIDKTNGKSLPIATGELSWKAGYWITCITLVVAVFVAFKQSLVWGCVISAMCTIGVVYSVPPFRLKRYAVPAALCIVSARALLATIGGAYTFSEAMGRPLDDFSIFHLEVFTSILVVFTTVIALMKDVPDIEGDAMEGVRSLPIVLGPGRVSRICFTLLLSVYVIIIPLTGSSSLPCLFMHLYGFLFLLMRWNQDCDSKEVAIHNYFNVVWPLFYFEFLAYLGPVALDHILHGGSIIPAETFCLLLGVEASYLLNSKVDTGGKSAALFRAIKESSGLNVSRIHKNLLRLYPVPEPSIDRAATSIDDVDEAAEEISVALNMHSKLIPKFQTSSLKNAKKLVILAGDWLLARAVMSLCRTNNQLVIHEMGKAIASATQADDSEKITATVKFHASRAKLYLS